MAVAKILHKLKKVSKKINFVLGAVESTRAITFQPNYSILNKLN